MAKPSVKELMDSTGGDPAAGTARGEPEGGPAGMISLRDSAGDIVPGMFVMRYADGTYSRPGTVLEIDSLRRGLLSGDRTSGSLGLEDVRSIADQNQYLKTDGVTVSDVSYAGAGQPFSNEQLGSDMVTVRFVDGSMVSAQKGMVDVMQASGALGGMQSAGDFSRAMVELSAASVDPESESARLMNMFNERQLAYNAALQESDPNIARNIDAFQSYAGALSGQPVAGAGMPAGGVSGVAKPNMREFMEATGVDAATASQALYGSVGSNVDIRDWGAIMSSGDPLRAAQEATRQMYSTGAPIATDPMFYDPQTRAYTPTAVARDYDVRDVAGGPGAPRIQMYDNQLMVVDAAGLPLTGLTPQNAASFGVTQDQIDAAVAAAGITGERAGRFQGVGYQPYDAGSLLRSGYESLLTGPRDSAMTKDTIRPTEPYSVVQQPVVTPTGPNAPARQPAQFTPNLSEYYKTFGGQTLQPSLPTMQPNYSVPTVTGGLSSMPSQFTTKTSYTGTPSNVSPELYQQPDSQQGVRLVMYRNPQGATMYITEANGVPMTAVPEGYYKITIPPVQPFAKGGMTKQQSSSPFTPQQKFQLLQRMGYRGPASEAQMQQFIEANPATAARFGKLSRAAMKRMGMAQGGVVKGYQEGGLSDWEEYKSFQGTPDDMFGVKKFAGRTFTDPATGTTYTSDGTKWTVKNPPQDIFNEGYPQPTQPFTQQLQPRLEAVQMTGSQQPTVAPVSTIRPDAAQFIPSDAGMTVPQAPFAEAATMQEAQQAGMPIMTPASVMQSVGITPAVTQAMEGLTPAVGQVSRESQVQAAQLGESSVSQLQAAQGQAYMMNNPVQREIQSGELITGAADAAKAAQFVEQIQAAEATPTKQATVQGQLEGLMQQFEGGATPAWAAGAMRNAMATLSARGLGASSLAGQAVIQAAMESALPIAQIDAQTRASFESQNLSNRQQVAMFAAQQRAAFMQMEFDQAFQSRVQNAARIADVANMNFTAEQQIALENSRAANTMNLANLGNRQAMIMAEAAALSNIDMANLNNRQQAAVQNAQNFLQMDMANLGNEQQTALFRAQQTAQALFTDQAAENAARQFNATSDNQTKQFFASLGSQVSQFNAAQRNAIDQYNIDQVNSIRRFNSEIQQQRDLFNAQNGLVIAQANAQWRQNLTTLNTAAQNEANRQFAQVLNNMSQTTLDQIWQKERDIMSYTFNQAESALNRASEVLLAQMEIEGKAALEAGKAEGSFMGKIFEVAAAALAKKIAG